MSIYICLENLRRFLKTFSFGRVKLPLSPMIVNRNLFVNLGNFDGLIDEVAFPNDLPFLCQSSLIDSIWGTIALKTFLCTLYSLRTMLMLNRTHLKAKGSFLKPQTAWFSSETVYWSLPFHFSYQRWRWFGEHVSSCLQFLFPRLPQMDRNGCTSNNFLFIVQVWVYD